MPEEKEPKGAARQKILDAAGGTFAHLGYEGASVGKIMKATGLSKGTLYWYFTGKLELYREIMRNQKRAIQEYLLLPDEMTGKIEPVSFLIEKGSALIDKFVENPETRFLYIDLFIIAQRGDSESRALVREGFCDLIDTLPAGEAPQFLYEDRTPLSIEHKDRLCCLMHCFNGLVMGLGIIMNSKEAKTHWEALVRLFLEEKVNNEAQ